MPAVVQIQKMRSWLLGEAGDADYGKLLRLGLLLHLLMGTRVKGDAVEVIVLGTNWSISNQNGCKY